MTKKAVTQMPLSPADKLLYKPAEVAMLLSCSRSKVYELMACGELATITLPSRRLDATRPDVRITRGTLEAWIAMRQRRSA